LALAPASAELVQVRQIQVRQILVDFLSEDAIAIMDVPEGELFYSSRVGSIPNGELFVRRILLELRRAKLIISIVS
jgi:hypothetical protein